MISDKKNPDYLINSRLPKPTEKDELIDDLAHLGSIDKHGRLSILLQQFKQGCNKLDFAI
jgi:hypothetical protein